MKLWVASCMNFCLYVQDFEQVSNFFSPRKTVKVHRRFAEECYNVILCVIFFGKYSRRRVLSSGKMIPVYFLHLSKVWSILRHWSVERVHKKMLLNAFIFFLAFLLLFFIIRFMVLSFSFLFLMKYQISAIRVLTNHKHKFVVSNRQRNCMLRWISR